MAAMDFPANPTNGQVYGNYIYSTATGAWNAKPLTGQKTVVSATAPATPSLGDEWFNTVDGNLYVYYTDVDGSQWVQVKSDATLSSTLGSRVDALDYGANVNYIINGGFDIWQRGTSFSNPESQYTADRFISYYNGSGATRTWSRQSFTGNEIPGNESQYYMRLNQSVAGTGGTYNLFSNRIEDVRTLANNTVTFSFWAKADSAKTVAVYLVQNFGSGGSAEVGTASANISLTTSWARYTYTTLIPSISGKTVGANSYVDARFVLPLNSTFTIDMWGLQLQQGVTATAFHRSSSTLQGELAACQRYYQVFGGGSEIFVSLGAASTTGQLTSYISPKVTMRATPTVTHGGAGNFINHCPGVSYVAISALAFNIAANSIEITSTNASTGAGAGVAGRLQPANSSGWVALSSEL